MILWKPIRDVVSTLTPRQQRWLTYTGSLTKRLRQTHAGKITQYVHQEDWCLPEVDEAVRLNITRALALVRETDWHWERETWVATRAIIPAMTLQNQGKALAEIGHASLGDFLFADPHLTRSEFEVAELPHSHPYLQRLPSLLPLNHQTYWARRSVFTYFGRPLLVMEIFFPPVFTIDPPTDE